jgi:hypothetical protein
VILQPYITALQPFWHVCDDNIQFSAEELNQEEIHIAAIAAIF